MDTTIKTVKLVADSYPPYQYEENGILKGIDHDIITRAFKEHGIEIETRLFKWDVCIEQMEKKEADGIFQITRTPERERIFLFSKPLRTARTVFYRNAKSSLNLMKDVELSVQLEGYRLGVLAGYSYDFIIDSLQRSLKAEVNNQESLLEGLIKEEFDLAIMDMGVAAYLLKKKRINGIERIEGYEIKRKLHVAFQKNLIELVNLFNSGLDRIKEKGLYNQIFKNYGCDY